MKFPSHYIVVLPGDTPVAEWEDVICDQDDWIDLHEDFDEDMGFDPYLGCYTDDC